MKFDKYNRIARLYPTIITALPFVILFSYITTVELKNLLKEILVLQILTGVSLTMVTIYIAMQINRFIAKEFFEKIFFKNELEMPTTNFLLFTDSEFSKAYKTRLRGQIKTDFNLEINSENDEQNNLLETRKQIVGAVGLIRNKVKNGQLLLQHNIEYGFVRNLIGGSVLGFISSIFNLIYFHFISENVFLFKISIITTLTYLTICFLSKYLINRFGQLYAKRLYQEYLTL
jgi:hypothetical protein